MQYVSENNDYQVKLFKVSWKGRETVQWTPDMNKLIGIECDHDVIGNLVKRIAKRIIYKNWKLEQ